MDREGFHAKIEMIDQLVYKKDHKRALELVDSIDWKKVKDAHALYTAGEVYASNKRYQESKEIFLMAYHRLPVRKNILYRLVEVSIKTGELEDAWEYYRRFLEASPNDDIHYVLKYKIYSAQDAPLEEQIQILEEYKERDYTERWSYELARLYYKAGDGRKCIETCDDIVLWFSEGGYVKKALELKQRLTNLTPRQRDIYETMIRPEGLEKPDPVPKESAEEPYAQAEGPQYLEAEDTTSDVLDGESVDDQMPIIEDNDSLQEKISKGIKDIFAGIVKDWEGEDDFLEDYTGTPKINIADVIPSQKIEESIREKEEIAAEQAAAEAEPEVKGEQDLVEIEPDGKEEQDLPEIELEAGGEQDLAEIEPDGKEEQDLLYIGPETSGGRDPVERGSDEEEEQDDLPETGADAEGVQDGEKVGFDTSKLPRLELPEFNLETVILSAAEKQGIGVPDGEVIKAAPVEIEEPAEESIEEDPEGMLEGSEDAEGTGEPVPEEPEAPPVIDKVQPEGELRPQEEILSEEESLLQFIEAKEEQEITENGMIVPRSKVLDDTEIKIFSYFSAIPGMQDQLVEALADAQSAAADKTSRSGNIIVMGNQRTGKSRLIEGLIKAVCRELHMPAARIAVVEAVQLNGKDMPKIVSKLSGGFLVIKKTSQLEADSVFQLNQALEFRTDGLTVILEDEKIGMRKFIAKYQKFAKKFTSTINIPVFTNDELVHFAKIYADEMGYVMDTMGVLALYNLIGDNQKEDEPMTIGTVKDMMDVAITRAESSHRKLQRSISKKRFDDEGKIILYEKDFK